MADVGSQDSKPSAEEGLGCRRVLVVDDDPIIASIIEATLSDEGFEVTEARDGLEALEHLSDASPAPHVIVLDLMLPKMDGQTFVAELRRRDLPNEPAIVVVSAAVDAAAHAREMGAAALVEKPFDLDVLVSAVVEAIKVPVARPEDVLLA